MEGFKIIIEIKDLKKHVSYNKIGNLYLFYGTEDFLKKYYLRKIEKNFIKEDFKQFNYVIFEEKAEFESIKNSILTLPVFDEKKLILIKNANIFKIDSSKTALSNFIKLIQSVPDYVCLIFYQESVDKRSSLYKAVNKSGYVIEFKKQKVSDLIKWVVQMISKNNKKISYEVAKKIIEYCGPDMQRIYTEVQKLILYLATKTEVKKEDIDNIIIRSLGSGIFDLTDAISEQNVDRALKILDGIISAREPIPKILFMINRQFRILMKMKLLEKQNLSKADLSKKLGVMPFLLPKIKKQANLYTVEQLGQLVQKSLELEVKIKSGGMNNARLALEIIIALMVEKV